MYEYPKLNELKTVTFGPYYALVPEKYNEGLINEIKSVFAKNHMRLKSIDYTKKNYIDSIPRELIEQTKLEHEKQHPAQQLLKDIIDTVDNTVRNLDFRLNETVFHKQTIGSLAVDTTFTRLPNSYECAGFLIKNHFFFESVSIVRMIFEQLVYCINTFDLTDEKFNNLSKNESKKILSPTNISRLRLTLTDIKVDKLYSYLSEITHIDYKQLGRYISFDQKEGKVVIIAKNIHQSIESAILLLRVIDIHCLVFEYTLKNHLSTKLEFLLLDDNMETNIDNNRPLKNVINSFSKRLIDLLENEKA
jgi:hypothetical protein